MIPLLLILLPFVAGILSFFVKSDNGGKQLALFFSIATLAVMLLGLCVFNQSAFHHFDVSWLVSLGSRFTIGLDGMGKMLCLLTAISFPIIIAATYNNKYKSSNNFYALLT